MSLKLNKKQFHHLQHQVSVATENNEMEMEVVFYPVNMRQRLEKEIFQRVFHRLSTPKFGFQSVQYPEVLDIRVETEHNQLSDIRISIYGVQGVKYYCKHNRVTGEGISPQQIEYLHKTRLREHPPLDVWEYGYRVNLKREIKLSPDNPEVTEMMDKWERKRKIFRLKKRYSFITPDKLFRFDLTMVRTSKKNKRGQYTYYRNFEDARVLQNFPEYEMELEFIGSQHPDVLTTVMNKYFAGRSFRPQDLITTVIQKLVQYTGYILQVVQGSNFLISNAMARHVLEQYVYLTHPRIRGKLGPIDKQFWIGPQPVSIEMAHIRDYADKGWEGVLSIRKGYSVTPKADGERCLMFIDRDGNIMLINNRMEIKNSGLTTIKHKNCVLDGELVSADPSGNAIQLFLIFDLYYLDGRDYMDRFLMRTPKDKVDKVPESRLELLDQFMATEIPALYGDKADRAFLKIEKKSHYFGDISDYGTAIFTKCKEILQREQEDQFSYPIDGLVFTPVKLAVGASFDPRVAKARLGTTWRENLKWKPAKDNTIDFLVEIMQEENDAGQLVDAVKYQAGPENTLIKYKTLILKTGYNPYLHEKLNVCKLLREGEDSDILETQKMYRPKEFQPTQPPDPDAYLANVPMTETGVTIGSSERLLCVKTGDEIQTNTIVEMAYDTDKEGGWRWIARNVRYDKTASYRAGNSMYGNSFEVAESIWRTYHNPITAEMISGEAPIPDEMEEETRYYARKVARDLSFTKNLLDFHNLYVKFMLITGVAAKRVDATMLDLACGKAGDLPKWKAAGLKLVLGVDISKDNIENIRDGACMRYYQEKLRTPDLFQGHFLVGDSSKLLSDGAAAPDGEYQNLFRVMWGHGITESKVDEAEKPVWEIARSGFDLLSVQFALHYFFQNTATLQGFLANVIQNTKVNGYFLGTCFDGQQIFQKLKHLSKGEDIAAAEKDFVIWKIKKEYSATEFPADQTSLGLTINVYMETINQYFREYLVNFEYLTKVMEWNGFRLISTSEAQEMGLPRATGLFRELYEQMMAARSRQQGRRFGSASQMTAAEKEISFMNRYFVYQKLEEVTEVSLQGPTPAKKQTAAAKGRKKTAASVQGSEKSTSKSPAPGSTVVISRKRGKKRSN